MELFVSRFETWMGRWLFRKKQPEIPSALMDRLSHELRTSLTGIVGYAEFLESGSTDPMMNFTANIIRESGKSLTRTSQSFFDFYLLTQRQIRLKCSRFVFSDVARDVVNQYQTLAADRDMSLGFTCTENAIEVVVSSDVNRLRQVLEALVYGIVQASDKWSMVQVHLTLDEVQQDLWLSFVSSGVSVSPPQIQMQTQFWNRDDYQFRLQGGPGVELALAKAMIQFLDGSVQFEHSVEFPSRLVVKFPANRHASLKALS